MTTPKSPLPEGLMDAVLFATRDPEAFKTLSETVQAQLGQRVDFVKSRAYAELLVQRFQEFCLPNEFAPGGLAYWKPGLKNKRLPEYGQPVIVIAVLETPVLDNESKPSSQYYREPLDMQIGLLDRDNELVAYFVDSRRFAPYAAAVGGELQ